jgi:hypothetical protein
MPFWKCTRGFALADDVSLSELRSPAWVERLKTAHKLRLMSRNKTVGVVVDAAMWEALESAVHELIEDIVIAEKWGDRIDHERLPAAVAASLAMRLLAEHDSRTDS